MRKTVCPRDQASGKAQQDTSCPRGYPAIGSCGESQSKDAVWSWETCHQVLHYAVKSLPEMNKVEAS